jgi:O-acetyl-ADP-ribose deacetylase
MKITVCDVNKDLERAIAGALENLHVELEAKTGDITLLKDVDALVSPANSFGTMDGGVDAAYARRFPGIQAAVQREISNRPFGELLVGEALIVPTGDPMLRNLVVAPTMRVPRSISNSSDVFLAVRAAYAMARSAGFASIAFPGMGTGTGQIPFETGALAIVAGIRAVIDGSLPVPPYHPFFAPASPPKTLAPIKGA